MLKLFGIPPAVRGNNQLGSDYFWMKAGRLDLIWIDISAWLHLSMYDSDDDDDNDADDEG